MVAARKNHDQAILYGKLRDFGVTSDRCMIDPPRRALMAKVEA
jgi:hypothetical protein